MAEESASRESLSQLLNNSNRFEYSACFFSDEDTSSTGTNVSRLITEEDIVDTMFDMCDTNKTGTVPVSTLIEMLKSTTGSLSAESQQYLDDLALIFDPEGKDVSIELEVYREGMMQWIKEIKERSAGVDDDNCKLISVSPEKCSSPQVNTSPHQRVLEHLNGISFGSLEASGCAGDASTHEWDIMELSNKVADLQYHNKKLTDENIKLQVQLENAEESSTLSAQEMEGLKKQLRNMQRIMEKNRELQHEVTDVKNSLALSEENTKVLQKKLAITERENSNLEAQLDQLQKELIQTNCDLDAAKTTHNELLGSLTDFKQLKAKFEEMGRVQEVQLSERCKETEEMKATLDQWKRISEGLRQEKNELELQLIQTQHSMHMQCDELVGDESSIVSENEKELITRSLFPSASSTPFSSKLPSIHFELKNLIQSEKDLPSPFCEKALIDDVFSSDIGDDEGETVFDNLKPCDLFNDMKSVDLVEECRHNKDLVLEQLDLLSKPQGAQKTEDEHLNVTEITRQQLLQETEDFSKVIVELAKTKRASDLRVTKLAGALKRLKDKNIEIKRKHKEALKQMQDDSISLNLSVEELTELRERYEVEKSNRENIEKQLEDKEKQLTVAKEDAKGLSQTLEEMHTRKTSLENIIAELKRTNNELQEKCRVKEGLVSSLEEELAKSVNIAREEKEKTLSLQKSNVEEIQGIWNTLQSHLNPERENSAQLPVGVEAVKNQACQDIQKLRNQLKKTKGILACVKSKTFLQPGLTTTVQLESTSETDVQTSQLIDALDLESSFQKRISSLCNFCSGRGSSQSQCLVKSCQQLSIQGRRPFFTGTQNKRKPPLLQDFGCQVNTAEDNAALPSHYRESCYELLPEEGTFFSVKVKPDDHSYEFRQCKKSVLRRENFKDCKQESYESVEANDLSSSTESSPDTKAHNGSPLILQGSEGNTGEDVKEILDLRSKINSAAGFKSENYKGLVDIMAHCSSRICGQLFPDDRSSRPLLHSSSRLSALMEEELSDTEADSTPVKMEPSGSSLPGPSRLGSSDGDLSSARRKRLAMKDREKRETLGSSMEDKTFKLVNGKVEEMELTEADRKVNAQLLEEAAKASQASSLRRRRSSDPDRKSLHPARVPQVIHSSSSSTQRADKPVGRDRSPEQGSEHKPNIQSDQPKPHEEYNGMDHEVPPLVKIVVSDTNVPKRESSPRRFLLHPSMPAVPETDAISMESSQQIKKNEQQTNGEVQLNGGVHDNVETTPVTPNLPDSVLKKFGLLAFSSKGKKGEGKNNEATDKELEAKFNQLALAFKTDKTTVEKRLELQEHIRSVAEDSILNEIGDMKNSIEMLGLLCTDQESRDLYNAVQKHVEVVEYSTLRMSGHAELHGAVKQECRLSKAVDSMVQYVENLKRLHEKLSTELDETKRILKDNKIMCPSLSSDLGDSVLLRRTTTLKFTPPTHRTKSLPSSLTAVNYIPVTDKKEVNGPNARRRASVAALPRMLGGTGGVGFSASSPLEEKLVVDPNNEDARLRFQNLVANATVKNAVTGILRRASLERHMLEGTVGSSDCGQQGNKEEQLKETNDDVPNSSESPSHTQELEEPEDNVEREEEPEELQEGQIGMAVPEPKNSGALKMYAKHAVFKLRQLPFRNIGFSTLRGVSFVKDTVVENMWNRWPHQESSFKTFRMAVTGLVLFMALLSIIFTLLPSYTTADRGREVYTSLEELLRPYMGLRHHFRPPI